MKIRSCENCLIVMWLAAMAVPAKTIDISTFRDKLEGGWVGQGAGVTWGAPTEFSRKHSIIPMSSVPTWSANKIDGMFGQDDIYVEIPFINCMIDSGIACSWQSYGEYFSRTTFKLWCANVQARDNLKNGIISPWSGHFTRHKSVYDIDWQIESDYCGMVAPGMPMQAVDLSWRAGHVMNYGDGVYGGVMMAAMHAAAYFAGDLSEIIEAGRLAVPKGSVFRQVIDDMIAWREQYSDWTITWQALESKWGRFHRENGSCQDEAISAHLNGAYVLMGLLYGDGNMDSTIVISMRCGQDSDCNPSSAAGVLGNYLGLSRIDTKFKSDLTRTGKNFSATSYDFDEIIDVCVGLAREIVKTAGGTVTREGAVDEEWNIPDQSVVPVILEQVSGTDIKDPAQSQDGAYSQSESIMPVINSIDVTVEANRVTCDVTPADPGSILQYQWFFGDLSYATGKSVSHTYAVGGKREVICYVTDTVSGITNWKSTVVDLGQVDVASVPRNRLISVPGVSGDLYRLDGSRAGSGRLTKGIQGHARAPGVFVTISGRSAEPRRILRARASGL